MTNLSEYAEDRKKQLELFADTRFFMVLNSLITSGQASKIGANAILIYLILKVNADYSTGLSSIGIRRLSDLSGIKSFQTVTKAIKKLVEHDLISIVRNYGGLRNVYEVKDTITVYDNSGTEAGKAVVPYHPSKFKNYIQDVKNALLTGEVSKSSPVTLTFNIIVSNGDNAKITVNNNLSTENNSSTHNLNDLPEQIRNFLGKMLNNKKEE